MRYRLCWRSVSSPGRRKDLARAHLLRQHGTSLETLHENILHYSGNLGLNKPGANPTKLIFVRKLIIFPFSATEIAHFMKKCSFVCDTQTHKHKFKNEKQRKQSLMFLFSEELCLCS
jgi:hypothetical protein